jgi:hypothetical protein
MSTRVDCLLFSRRRLVGLQHASDGVLSSERAAFQWGWLEQMLAASQLPGGVMAAWNMPLRSGRMAVCRVMDSTEITAGCFWSVGVIVMEAEQHDWLLKRLGAAISDQSFWRAGQFLKKSGLVLPDWPKDPQATPEERSAMKDLLRRGVLKAPATVSGSARQADPQVLRLPLLLDAAQRMRLRWCVGLPQPAPGAVVATVRPLATPQVEVTPSRPVPEIDVRFRHASVQAAQSMTGTPRAENEQAAAQTDDVAGFDQPYAVSFKRPTGAGWAVPLACLSLMLTATLLAWWLVRGGRSPIG